jgi:hypothetical protein
MEKLKPKAYGSDTMKEIALPRIKFKVSIQRKRLESLTMDSMQKYPKMGFLKLISWWIFLLPFALILLL